jgi:hypothetical protein
MAEQNERDWEAAARARLERVAAGVVDDLRKVADDIEREARHNLASAAKADRDYDWQGYPRAAGQIVHSLQTLLFNLKLDSLVDAAADAEKAYQEKAAARAAAKPVAEPVVDKGGQLGVAGQRGAQRALRVLLEELDGWIEGQQANHQASPHRGENRGEECWRLWAPADFRSMVNDAARRVGVPEFPAPAERPEDKELER